MGLSLNLCLSCQRPPLHFSPIHAQTHIFFPFTFCDKIIELNSQMEPSSSLLRRSVSLSGRRHLKSPLCHLSEASETGKGAGEETWSEWMGGDQR